MPYQHHLPRVLTVGDLRVPLTGHETRALVHLLDEEVKRLRAAIRAASCPDLERELTFKSASCARLLHVFATGEPAAREPERVKAWRRAKLAELDGKPGVEFPHAPRLSVIGGSGGRRR